MRQPWGPFGLGALQDLVQEAFGSVDLDRSKVELDPVEPSYDDCAACKGKAFTFPSGLEDASEDFCGAHKAAAKAVNAERLAHARESNPAGWRAIDKAAMRINKLREPAFAPQPPRGRRRRRRRATTPARAAAARSTSAATAPEPPPAARLRRVRGCGACAHSPSSRSRDSILLVALVLAACGGEATKDLATLKGDGFTVSMPGKPTRTVQSVPTLKGTVKAISYTSDSKRQGVLDRLHGAAGGRSRATCTARSPAARQNVGGTVHDERNTTYQGFKARDARITGAADNKGTLFVRAILAEGRLYVLQFIGEGANLETPPPAYAEIVNSLKIG